MKIKLHNLGTELAPLAPWSHATIREACAYIGTLEQEIAAARAVVAAVKAAENEIPSSEGWRTVLGYHFNSIRRALKSYDKVRGKDFT